MEYSETTSGIRIAGLELYVRHLKFISLILFMNYYYQRSKVIWIIALAVIIVSFLAITIVPWFLFEETVYNPVLFITWLTATAIILTLIISYENVRELKFARIQDQLPKIELSKVTYSNEYGVPGTKTHSARVKFIIKNAGKGKAFNFSAFIYLIDEDNIQWIKKQVFDDKILIDADDEINTNTAFGSQNILLGDEFHLIIEQDYYDSYGYRVSEKKCYKLIDNGKFIEVLVNHLPVLGGNRKFELVKSDAEKKAVELSKKLGQNITTSVELELPNMVEFTIYKNGKVYNYDNSSLIFASETIVNNVFFAVEFSS